MLRLLHHLRTIMKVSDYCTTPMTMRQLLDSGLTRDQVYGAVKRGEIINSARFDAWGRIRKGPGLFVNPNPPAAYSYQPLLTAWSNA
jgi:hypothetical protein